MSIFLQPLKNSGREVVVPARFVWHCRRRLKVASCRLARRWMAAAPLHGIVAQEVRPGPAVESDAELLDLARRTGGTVYHPCGTVRMGSDPTAPLDARLRLRGLEGLRVVDASVFPRIPGFFIVSAVYMMAEKAAGWIRAANR